MSQHTIIAPLDSANLMNLGLLCPGRTTGSQRLHKRRLTRSSDEENHELPLNVSVSSPPTDVVYAVIPITLISYDTLIYVGFSHATASLLWTKWTDWPSQGPRRENDPEDGGLTITFKDFLLSFFENRTDATEDNTQEWRACLNELGIAEDTQEAIMDPRFSNLRLSNSCLYWAKDTIEMRYAGLEDIQRCSREREAYLRRTTTRPADSQEGHRRQSGQSIDGRSGALSNQGQRSISSVQQQNTPGVGPDIWGSARAIAALNAPGHTLLFKGLDQGRIAGLFDEAGTLDRISTLLSTAPSDFSGTRSMFYFTPDRYVAEYYAAFAKRRANCESVVIVCLSVPNAAIESLREPDLLRIFWPADEWKQLIWHCRTAKPLPVPLRKYRRAILVIGTVSRKPDSVYHAMPSWEKVTNACLLRIGQSTQNNPAVQYVFSGEEEGHDFLITNCRNNIKVFPFPPSQLEEWLATRPSN